MRIAALKSLCSQNLAFLGMAAALALSAACGTDAPPDAAATAEEDTDSPAEDATIGGDAGVQVDGAPRTGDTAASDSGTQPDGAVEPADALEDGGEPPLDAQGDESVGPGEDATVTADAVTPADTKPSLVLPDCAAGSCGKCGFCAPAPLCVDGVTYTNDCEAICKLDLKEGLAPILDKVKKGACPACAACAAETIKCNTQTKKCAKCQDGVCEDKSTTACTKNADCVSAFVTCATLEDGTKVDVDSPCEVSCLKLKQGITNPTPGACKTKCSGAPSSCPTYKNTPAAPLVPVCAKEDGKTYANSCSMNNCSIDGCYAVGQTAATAACGAGLTKECDGACFAEASLVSDAAKNCPKDCNAVCGVLPTGKGMSFRNECLAKNAGAKVKDCAGISATEDDLCAADLYSNMGCCADVDYTLTGIKQVCAKKVDLAGGADTWVTFRNLAEFKCLAGTDKAWEQQYLGPCLCNCNSTENLVCGDDNITYLNQCVAECYNKKVPGFNTKPGGC